MEKLSRPYGASNQTESSWPDALSEAHRGFTMAFMEQAQQREEAVISQFLAAKVYRADAMR